MKKNIIAIFGGSFNPPANSHINLAEQILDENKQIEKIIFVPVSTKYNKKDLAQDEDRLNMLKMICKGKENLEVSDIETTSTRQLYTIETLNIIKNRNPEKQIWFILGTDNLKELETWYRASELLGNFKIIVLERDNDVMENIINNSDFLKRYKTSFVKIKNLEKIDMSSSYIRKKIELGESIKGLIPKEIETLAIQTYKALL